MLTSKGLLKTLIQNSTLCLALGISLFASAKPLKVSTTIDVRDNVGSTFFNVMINPDGGIKPSLDVDYDAPFKITDAKTFRKAAADFDHMAKLEKRIKGGAKGLDQIVASLAGKTVKMEQLYGLIMGAMNAKKLYIGPNSKDQSRLAGALVSIVGLASGKGVAVILDDNTYCYNFGYAVGSGGTNDEADVVNRRTGRSYGASKARRSYDPSDNDYLRDLSVYAAAASDEELRAFYKTLFDILLKSDTSGIKKLNPAGQTVMADFLAIYMAELIRHLMTGLKRYEWENALTEITLLAAYSSHEDGMTLDPTGEITNDANRELISSGKLKPMQRLLGYFGVGTDGSGLDGKNKQRRHNLTRMLSKEFRKIDEAQIAAIEKIIEAKKGADIYDWVMEFINNYDTQKDVTRNATELTSLMVDFTMATRDGAATLSGGVLEACEARVSAASKKSKVTPQKSKAASKRAA